MTKSDLFLVATTLCLCGCATPIKVLDYYGADSATLAKIRDLQVVEDDALSEGGYTDLGVVNGLFCNRTPGDPDASADIAQRLARDQVDLRAAELGADYITAPQCTLNGKMDLSNNCWATLVCSSHALVKSSPQDVQSSP